MRTLRKGSRAFYLNAGPDCAHVGCVIERIWWGPHGRAATIRFTEPYIDPQERRVVRRYIGVTVTGNLAPRGCVTVRDGVRDILPFNVEVDS